MPPINKASFAQLITSIDIPQQDDSRLLVDAHFGSLCYSDGATAGGVRDGKNAPEEEIQASLLMAKAKVDSTAIVNAAIEIVDRQFMRSLRLTEPMEAGKPLASYGLNSLAAVECREWVRMELGADSMILEITSASSLVSLCEKIISEVSLG